MNKIYQAFQSITPNNIESIKEQAQLREGRWTYIWNRKEEVCIIKYV